MSIRYSQNRRLYRSLFVLEMICLSDLIMVTWSVCIALPLIADNMGSGVYGMLVLGAVASILSVLVVGLADGIHDMQTWANERIRLLGIKNPAVVLLQSSGLVVSDESRRLADQVFIAMAQMCGLVIPYDKHYVLDGTPSECVEKMSTQFIGHSCLLILMVTCDQHEQAKVDCVVQDRSGSLIQSRVSVHCPIRQLQTNRGAAKVARRVMDEVINQLNVRAVLETAGKAA